MSCLMSLASSTSVRCNRELGMCMVCLNALCGKRPTLEHVEVRSDSVLCLCLWYAP